MAYHKKYVPGNPIRNIEAFAEYTRTKTILFYHERPLPSSFARNWSLHIIEHMLNMGYIRSAIKLED